MVTELPDSKGILIADDEQELRESLRDILEAKGFRVQVTDDGDSAVALVNANRYCLVIMDIRMPRKDGIEALREMMVIRPGIPVVMVTAFRLDEDKRRLVTDSALALYTKPLDIDALVALAERHCFKLR